MDYLTDSRPIFYVFEAFFIERTLLIIDKHDSQPAHLVITHVFIVIFFFSIWFNE